MTVAQWTSPGWTDWVVPSDCRQIDACWAVGGGRDGVVGGSVYGQYSYGAVGGGGGAGGAASLRYTIATTPGETLRVYVGAAGTYSGLYRTGQGWLCLAQGASAYDAPGQASGGVGDQKTSGNYGGGGGSPSGNVGGVGGNGASPVGPFGGSGGSGGAGAYGGTSGLYGIPGYPAGNGINGSGYGAGGGGGGGGAGPNQGPGGSPGSGIGGTVYVSYTPYVPHPPTVTGLDKTKGRPGGGETVVITGTNFNYSVSAVKFGTTVAASFTVNSATQITAVTPSHAVGTVDITVTNVDGTSTTGVADQFTFKFQGGSFAGRGPF